MKNNPSTAHHYIPVFYLENFTNNNGEFYIYNVKQKKFKKNGKLFTPQSHFFKKKGNSFEEVQVPSDFLEKEFYAPLDGDVANIFRKIKDSKDQFKYGLTDMEIVHLEYFFGCLYWRNPAVDEVVKYLVETKSLMELGLRTKMESEQLKKFEMALKTHPDFYKIIKSVLPRSLFGNYKKALDMKYQILDYSCGLPSLLGDNPVVLKQKGHNNYVEDMLVPITNEMIFSRNRNEIKFIDTTVKILIDTMLLKQANEYVCVTDKIYIEQLEDCYSGLTDLDNLRQLLFHGLEKDHSEVNIITN